jgi:hypothetical protein
MLLFGARRALLTGHIRQVRAGSAACGGSTTGSLLVTPSCLACRTRAVWQYRPVPSLSGLLPPCLAPPRKGCPQLQPGCCDSPAVGPFTPPGHTTPRGARPCRHRPCRAGVSTAGTSSGSASNSRVSLTLAAVTAAVSGRPRPSLTRCSLDPGLPRSTGCAPTWSPHGWRARWPRPRRHATSPAGRPARAGPRPPGGGGRTRRPWPTGPAGARRSPASRSRVLAQAGAPRGRASS